MKDDNAKGDHTASESLIQSLSPSLAKGSIKMSRRLINQKNKGGNNQVCVVTITRQVLTEDMY